MKVYHPKVHFQVEGLGIDHVTVSWEMSPLLLPFQLVLLMFSGWVHRHQLDVIEYLQEENRVLKARLGRRPFYPLSRSRLTPRSSDTARV